ncbi:MAG: methyltransferase domain-containing protein [Candidatus Diapherotrites archaeon]
MGGKSMATGKGRVDWLGKHFEFNAKKYAYSYSNWEPRRARMLEIMPQEGISRALEAGCGSNPLIEALPAGVEKFGLDIARQRPKGVKFRRHNVEDGIPFADGYFDLVVAGEIIEHVYETGRFLRECNRVLRKGGTLLVSTPNTGSLRNIKDAILGRQPRYMDYDAVLRPRDSGHIRHYSRSALFSQLWECGFSAERLTSDFVYFPLHFHIKPIGWLGEKLAALVPRYGDSLIVRARKISDHNYCAPGKFCGFLAQGVF